MDWRVNERERIKGRLGYDYVIKDWGVNEWKVEGKVIKNDWVNAEERDDGYLINDGKKDLIRDLR